jgi:Transposase DDE domain
MPSIIDQLTALYVFVDDFLTTHSAVAQWRQSPHDRPALAEAEVLTLALWPGCLGGASRKQTDRLVASNYRSAFPPLCSSPPGRARRQARAAIISALLRATPQMPEQSPAFSLIDAQPLPVCSRRRQGRVRRRREDSASWGQTSQGWFLGFKRHVLRPIEGRMVNLVLTPGHGDDRSAVLALRESVEGGVTLGDLGDRGQQRAAEGAEEAGMLVLTRADAPEQKALLAQVRQAMETSFSQLWYKFMDRVFSRSWRGLWNTVPRKVIHYHLCQAGVLSV